MRSTWTDSRLDDFAKHTDRRFDAVDRRFDRLDQELGGVRGEIGEVRSEIAALQRTIIQVGAVGVAALIGLIATQL